MKLQIRVENGVIADAKFKTFGCGSAIASSSLATEMIKGMTLDQAASIKNTQIVTARRSLMIQSAPRIERIGVTG